MKDYPIHHLPIRYEHIAERSRAIGFTMPSDESTGALIRSLVASKRNASILELGTGTGLGTCWLLDGMDPDSRLISVENEERYQAIARECLSGDSRATFLCEDGLRFLERQDDETYDFIYADTWPGKYVGFDHSLRILRPGGMIVLDDMLPQPNWPADHPPKVEALLKVIDALPPKHFQVVKLCWFTGHIVISKRSCGDDSP